jgi:hypothetical protein
MELDVLKYELTRRKIVLQLEGMKVIALDPYSRLSPRLDIALRQHKDTLLAELNAFHVSACGFERVIDEALVQTDIEALPERIETAFQQGSITQEEAEALAQRMVEKARSLPVGIEDLPLSILAQSGQVRQVHSKVLDETVLWAADNAIVADDTEWVVYRAYELKALTGTSAEELRAIHSVKKVMDGALENPEQKTTIDGATQ